MRVQIKVLGLDRLQQQLQRLGRDWPTEIEKGAQKALYYIWSRVPPYPPKPAPGTASKHWTDKQRRWFFWALRTGQITGEYRRTGTLGRTVTADRGRVAGALGEVRTLAEQISIVAGSALPYAELVIGQEQAPVHAGRWWRLIDIIQDAIGGVTQILQAASNAALRKFFG